MQKHDWQTVIINYRERLFWVLVLVQLTAISIFAIPNPELVKWAKNLLGSWYYDDFIWMVICAVGFGCILITSKVFEKLIFSNLEQ
jgi:asparagine N-glycosylation enzyme membrane subunit Stt3